MFLMLDEVGEIWQAEAVYEFEAVEVVMPKDS